MATILRKIFIRRKPIPLACSMSLENEEGHVHTDACFVSIQPLSIIEFFQSQSCVACPPIIPKVLQATMDPNLLLLSYNVTLFDHTGWQDTFANSRWDNRQRAYLKKWDRKSIFTPQVVADGIADGTGAEGNSVEEIVERARSIRHQVLWSIVVDTNETELRVDSNGVGVGTFDIVLVNYDPQEQIVKVKNGTNKGKKIKHLNLVRDVIKIGEWTGGNLTITLPDMSQIVGTGLSTVAMVQGQNGGPILAAQKL